ncbi:hypothetical protein GCM10009548_65650 [Streptomyces malaysiensis subsp. malaysiensis]
MEQTGSSSTGPETFFADDTAHLPSDMTRLLIREHTSEYHFTIQRRERVHHNGGRPELLLK